MAVPEAAPGGEGVRKLAIPQWAANRLVCLACCAYNVTLVACYRLWVGDGCVPFAPFVSDLGLRGAMRATFTAGLLLGVAAQFVWFVHIIIVRELLLSAVSAEPIFVGLHYLAGIVGAGVTCCMALITLVPWDQQGLVVYVHFACANAIFSGGLLYAVISALLAWPLSSIASWDRCKIVRAAQMPLAVASACLLAAAMFCLAAAHDSDPSFFKWSWWVDVMHMARTDFESYCGGKASGSWHVLPWINRGALCEWLCLLSLQGAMLASHADSELYFATHQAFLGEDREDRLAHAKQRGHGKEQCWNWRLPFLSRWRARVLLCLVVCAPVVAAVMQYAAWLRRGCLRFLPFPTELRMLEADDPSFGRGLCLQAAVLGGWLVHNQGVRQHALHHFPRVRTPGLYQLANFAEVVHGGGLVVSIVGLSCFPPDRHFFVHTSCVGGALYSGSVWAVCNLFLYWRPGEQGPAASTAVLAAKGVLSLAMVGSAQLMSLCVAGAVTFSPSFAWGWWAALRGGDATEETFCRGEVLHASPWMGPAALFEWSFVLSLLGFVLAAHVGAEGRLAVAEQLRGGRH